MTYELKDILLLDLLRDACGPIPQRRDRSLVWPARPGAVPEIPFKPYTAIMRDAFLKADAANKRCEAFIGELNSQRGVGNVVQPPVMPPRRNGRRPDIDGKREAAGRSSNDLRDVDHREARKAATARREACKNHFCPEYFARSRGCLDRQRAGMCPAQSGCDMRSDTGGIQGVGKPA